MRAFRGLAVVFVLSFLSLIGVMLTVTALGGLDGWSRWQFIGLFGMVEAASGLANIVLPNIWRLPVAEIQTKPSTRVRLAASTVRIPHWGGAARAIAGVVLVVAAGVSEGFGPATLMLAPLLALFAVIVCGVSTAVARLGVEWPDYDVVQFIVRRGGRDLELPAISLGASALQFVLSIITVPVVKVVPASALYRPEIGPSPAALGLVAALAVATAGLALVAWWGRIDWHAPRDQQKEAEANA